MDTYRHKKGDIVEIATWEQASNFHGIDTQGYLFSCDTCYSSHKLWGKCVEVVRNTKYEDEYICVQDDKNEIEIISYILVKEYIDNEIAEENKDYGNDNFFFTNEEPSHLSKTSNMIDYDLPQTHQNEATTKESYNNAISQELILKPLSPEKQLNLLKAKLDYALDINDKELFLQINKQYIELKGELR